MRLALFLSLSVVFSACARPQVTVCVVDYANQALQCARPDDTTFTLPLPQADNYVCMSPSDTELLLNWVKARCSK